MIDRLAKGLAELATLAPDWIAGSEGERIRGDCADALRLALDCPQEDLTPGQRAALTRLSDLLEQDGSAGPALVRAASAARAALGLAAAGGGGERVG